MPGSGPAHQSTLRSVSGVPTRQSMPGSGPVHQSTLRSVSGVPARQSMPGSGPAHQSAMRNLGGGSSSGVASLHRIRRSLASQRICSRSMPPCTLGGDIRHEVEANRIRMAGWTDHATPRAAESSHVRGRTTGAGPRNPWARARTGGVSGAGRSQSLRPVWVPGAGATTTGKHGKPLVATGRRLRGGQTGLAATRDGQTRLTAGNETCSRARPPGGLLPLTKHGARRSLTLSSERIRGGLMP